LISKTNIHEYLFYGCTYTVSHSVADPGFGAFLTPGSRIRYGKKSGSGSGMNIQDNFSESLFADRGSESRDLFDPVSGIRDGKNQIRHPG
jgi:hypothetical protein